MSKSEITNSRFLPSTLAAIIGGAVVMPVFVLGVRFIETTLHSQFLLVLWSVVAFFVPFLFSTSDIRYLVRRRRGMFGFIRAAATSDDFRLFYIPAWKRIVVWFVSSAMSLLFSGALELGFDSCVRERLTQRCRRRAACRGRQFVSLLTRRSRLSGMSIGRRLMPINPVLLAKWRCIACAAAITSLVGCESPGGALKISDPLSELGMEMNRTGAAERTWTYRHDHSVAYWIVVAPAGTSADRIETLGLPDTWVAAAKDCVKAGKAALFLAENARSSCVRPLISPEVHELHSVRKNADEEAIFTLRNSETGSWLVSVK